MAISQSDFVRPTLPKTSTPKPLTPASTRNRCTCSATRCAIAWVATRLLLHQARSDLQPVVGSGDGNTGQPVNGQLRSATLLV
jgi:hypothetical protein